MSKKIGWIGLGRMGEAMVTKLLKAGHAVHVWNRTASKAAHLAEYGAKIETNKIDLATCDIVFTMVSTTDDLKEVLFGPGGLVTGAKKPQVVVDSSSISQEGSAEIRAQLEGMGVGYLCTPVSGNAKVAKAGKLLHGVVRPQGAVRAGRALSAGHGAQGHVGGRGRAGPHLEDRAQHHVRRHHPEPVRDHRAGREGRHPAQRLPGKHQRLGAGFHVHALQDAGAEQPDLRPGDLHARSCCSRTWTWAWARPRRTACPCRRLPPRASRSRAWWATATTTSTSPSCCRRRRTTRAWQIKPLNLQIPDGLTS